MKRAFTLIELLVICAILATMVAIGVGSIVSGQGMARVKGATRDVYAAIRMARSRAIVTGVRMDVEYANETIDDESAIRIVVEPRNGGKLMDADSGKRVVQPYYVMDYKDLPGPEAAAGDRRVRAGRKLVNIEGAEAKPFASPGGAAGETALLDGDEQAGDDLASILFAKNMDACVVKGMRIKVEKGDEHDSDETAEQARSRISVFSNVGLMSRGKESRRDKETQELPSSGSARGAAREDPSADDEMPEPVAVCWETNGAVEPHRVWIYPDGKKPEDGLQLDVDRFGAIKVIGGDGREEE